MLRALAARHSVYTTRDVPGEDGLRGRDAVLLRKLDDDGVVPNCSVA